MCRAVPIAGTLSPSTPAATWKDGNHGHHHPKALARRELPPMGSNEQQNAGAQHHGAEPDSKNRRPSQFSLTGPFFKFQYSVGGDGIDQLSPHPALKVFFQVSHRGVLLNCPFRLV